MNFDDLRAGWKTEVEQTSQQVDLTKVIESIKKETGKVDKSVKRRDILEISIALLLIPVWVWKLFYSVSLIQTVGLWVAIFASLFIPYKMLKAKQVEAPKNDSLLSFLTVEKVKLKNQKNLLETVAVWYIAPLMLSIFLITLGARVNSDGIPEVTLSLVIYYVACALLSVGVYFLNKRAARRQFTPLLDKVEQRIKELEDLNEVSE
jgi:hypothetical protein